MYVHAHFACYDHLFSLLTQYGHSSVCFIDEYGHCVPDVLAGCEEHNIACCFGAPFTAFMLHSQDRQEGFFIATNASSMRAMYNQMSHFSTQTYRLLTPNHMEELQSAGVYIFIRETDGYYRELSSHTRLPIPVVGFTSELQKHTYESIYELPYVMEAITPNHRGCPFISRVATNSSMWRSGCDIQNDIDLLDMICLNDYDEVEQQFLLDEYHLFVREGTINILHTLLLAKRAGVSFEPSVELKNSFLAFALGITSIKPSAYDTISKDTSFAIGLQKCDILPLRLAAKPHVSAKTLVTKQPFMLITAMCAIAQTMKKTLSTQMLSLDYALSPAAIRSKMRLHFIFHEDDQLIFEHSATLLELLRPELQLSTRHIAFPSDSCLLRQQEETIYLSPKHAKTAGVSLLNLRFLQN